MYVFCQRFYPVRKSCRVRLKQSSARALRRLRKEISESPHHTLCKHIYLPAVSQQDVAEAGHAQIQPHKCGSCADTSSAPGTEQPRTEKHSPASMTSFAVTSHPRTSLDQPLQRNFMSCSAFHGLKRATLTSAGGQRSRHARSARRGTGRPKRCDASTFRLRFVLR